MSKTVNVLILDDNRTIGECIVSRLRTASDSNSEFNDFRVKAHYIQFKPGDTQRQSKQRF